MRTEWEPEQVSAAEPLTTPAREAAEELSDWDRARRREWDAMDRANAQRDRTDGYSAPILFDR